MSDALRRRQAGGGKAPKSAPEAATNKATAEGDEPAFNPLSLRAVGAVFKRRWAAPLTVAVVCLALHFTGLLDDPSREAPSASSAVDFMQRLRLPVHYAKYGVGFGALFGSGMWVLVVSLSDSAEGKPDEGVSEHWAHNNGLLFVVLLGLGMATGGVLGFVAAALLDAAQHGLSPEGLAPGA